MAKAPLPGFAKTRLIPALGADGAAALAACLLEHTLQQTLAAALGPVDLCCAPDATHPALARHADWPGLVLSEQGDGRPRRAHGPRVRARAAARPGADDGHRRARARRRGAAQRRRRAADGATRCSCRRWTAATR